MGEQLERVVEQFRRLEGDRGRVRSVTACSGSEWDWPGAEMVGAP